MVRREEMKSKIEGGGGGGEVRVFVSAPWQHDDIDNIISEKQNNLQQTIPFVWNPVTAACCSPFATMLEL